MAASPLRPASPESPLKLHVTVAKDDFAALSTAVVKALTAACGQDRPASPASVGVEFAVAAFADQTVEVVAWVERATRTLVFAAAEARGAGGARLAIASAVFRVGG